MKHLQNSEKHLKVLSEGDNFEMNEIKENTDISMFVFSARTYKNKIEKTLNTWEFRIKEEARLANQS
jgi:hypothetical protein